MMHAHKINYIELTGSEGDPDIPLTSTSKTEQIKDGWLGRASNPIGRDSPLLAKRFTTTLVSLLHQLIESLKQSIISAILCESPELYLPHFLEQEHSHQLRPSPITI